MKRRLLTALLLSGALALPAARAQAQTVAELQRQINELKAMIRAQAEAKEPGRARRGGPVAARDLARPASARTTDAGTFPAAGRPVESAVAQPAAPAPVPHRFALDEPETWYDALVPPAPQLLADGPNHGARPKTWFERLSLRGYTQLRWNEFLSGDDTAPAGRSRLRSVHDSGISDRNNFTFRRVRLVLQGDIHERVFIYLQPDFAVNVSNQSGPEGRQHYTQLRDAYADVFLDDERRTKLRFGQQKVPYGWENLQSSQNRLTLDRSDAINSGVPGERDIGISFYYTPWHVQRIWDRLAKGGQKLFGNYGAFGLGIYNGQTINRIEANEDLMTVMMVTWPFELDGLGEAFRGQVLEVGGSAYRNRFRPELGSPGLGNGYDDERVGLHAILYPQPFGLQAEWNWGRGPEYDPVTRAIQTKPLQGGYVQAMYRVDHSPVGPFMPYARWQTYDGGWKVGTSAPRLDTDEFELGVEFQPIKAVELTLAYANMNRREASISRFGRAKGDLFRAQLQINY
ncbi:porin [Methylorubrum rhodesianum]|jgi:type II secretory pathway pseudopilin PulG|uniref:Porin n=1 Tax=Methylorubrum rhodesianum TaxID=29427 RepID=A0ABU9ZHJ1_9HYPH|nr:MULTISPECIES: porin [Methylorubrum]MBB5761548.1 type II secretory pathway pseudopilin PulG [Methylorubrum rhodesianum]MBI1687433.1 porin [Methylorubrum sp. DB1722]